MDRSTLGWLNGFLGVLIFSGSLPATRLAVIDFDPVFLTVARAGIAGLLGLCLLLATRQRLPSAADIVTLGVIALGVVVGFPLLTALALQHVTSAHATIFIGLLPIATAIFAVIRGAERPRPVFWLFAGAGAAIVLGYALVQGAGASPVGDGLMIAAVAICGLGYAEGARLSRRLGGWQVISWALVLCLPLSLPLAWILAPADFAGIGPQAWAGLGYVSLFSMLIGFVFWYAGLAQGGIAAVGQLQLLQPFFALGLAAAVVHEPVGWTLVGMAAGVALCVAGAKRYA